MFFKEALAGVRVTYFSRRFSEELNILRRGIMLTEYSHYRLIQVRENWTRPATIRTRTSKYAHANTDKHKANLLLTELCADHLSILPLSAGLSITVIRNYALKSP